MLYAAGDSFTFGDELAHPERDAWPVILNNLMGNATKCVNMSSRGISNQWIVDNTIAWLNNHLDDNILVIVGWTSENRFRVSQSPNRYYEVLKCKSGWIISKCSNMDSSQFYNSAVTEIIPKSILKLYPKIIMDNNEYNLYIKYQLMLSLHNILESNNVPHLFFDAFGLYKNNFDDYEDKHCMNGINFIRKHFYSRMCNAESCMMFDMSMDRFCTDNNCKYAKGGHPLEEGHKAWAEYLYTELKTRLLVN